MLIFKILFLLSITFVYSQPKNKINLPQGGEQITFEKTTPLLSIYVTANQEVYVESTRILFFEEIPLFIKKNWELVNPNIESLFRVLLYADQNTDYKFIDQLKSYIAKSSSRVFCQTDDINGVRYSIPLWLSGTITKLQATQIPLVSTAKEDTHDEFPFFLPPPPPPPMWYHQAEMDIYSGQK